MRMTDAFSPSELYVVLALAADHLVEDRPVVARYFGPERLKRHAKDRVGQGLEKIILETYRLEERVLKTFDDIAPFFRKTFFLSQIRSLRSLIELKDMKPCGLELFDAVVKILGFVPPPPYDAQKLISEKDAALRDCGCEDGALGGEAGRVTDNDIRKWIDYLTRCFVRDMVPHLYRCRDFAAFIDRPTVRLARFGRGDSLSHHIYEGRSKTDIRLSTDHYKNNHDAIKTLMHELCPGRHIYCLYREMLYGLGLLGEEATIDLIHSSETPISEGIADTAFYYLDSINPQFKSHARICTIKDQFRKKILYNVWHGRFLEQNMSEGQARICLIRDCGFDEGSVVTWLKFLSDWRIYYPSFPMGIDRLSCFTGENKEDLFYFYIPKSIRVMDKLDEHLKNEDRFKFR